jgi:two-component system, chemotaxis family, chemotaxis protein CheY
LATILIVDDSVTVREQVRQALATTAYAVVEASDGVEGLERLRAGDIDLVLCDINMPRMTGIEMLEELRKQGSKVPIIMLTTEGQPSMIRRAKECGARGWIVKPFRPQLLLMAISNVLAPGGPASAVAS